jgi:hypothetical protein
MDSGKTGCGVVGWIDLAQDREFLLMREKELRFP